MEAKQMGFIKNIFKKLYEDEIIIKKEEQDCIKMIRIREGLINCDIQIIKIPKYESHLLKGFEPKLLN